MIVTERPTNAWSFQWLIIDKENEKTFEELFAYHTIKKLNDSDKDQMVDKYFPDKSKTIYHLYVGKSWTSQQKSWYLEDIIGLADSMKFDVEVKKTSMYHYKK